MVYNASERRVGAKFVLPIRRERRRAREWRLLRLSRGAFSCLKFPAKPKRKLWPILALSVPSAGAGFREMFAAPLGLTSEFRRDYIARCLHISSETIPPRDLAKADVNLLLYNAYLRAHKPPSGLVIFKSEYRVPRSAPVLYNLILIESIIFRRCAPARANVYRYSKKCAR